MADNMLKQEEGDDQGGNGVRRTRLQIEHSSIGELAAFRRSLILHDL